MHAVLTWQRRHVGADGRRRRWCCLLLAASIRVHLDHFALVHFVRHIPCGQMHVLEAWEQQCWRYRQRRSGAGGRCRCALRHGPETSLQDVPPLHRALSAL